MKLKELKSMAGSMAGIAPAPMRRIAITPQHPLAQAVIAQAFFNLLPLRQPVRSLASSVCMNALCGLSNAKQTPQQCSFDYYRQDNKIEPFTILLKVGS